MNQKAVLIVEDDPSLLVMLSETLRHEQYQIFTAHNYGDALALLSHNAAITLVVSGICSEGSDENDLLTSIRREYPDLPCIVAADEAAAIPVNDDNTIVLDYPPGKNRLVEAIRQLASTESHATNGYIAVDRSSIQLAEVARRVALTDASVMIRGESGVGKEVISRFIHKNSPRSTGPFVAINCAAIPENMLESELFGYEKGAFTGAYKSKAGKFEQAQGGTLLLDEITEMDFSLQAKLLRVLQERELERIGGGRSISLDVRILSTTNRDIYQAVSEGAFREDLFYRLNVFPICIPPLRERREDILPLANKILESHSGPGENVSFSASASDILVNYSWPGNVRELDNVVQRALILRSGDLIEDTDIHIETEVYGIREHQHDHDKNKTASPDLGSDLKAREQDLIISALKERTSRKEVAKRLGISSRTLRYKLAKMRDAGIAIPA